MRPHYLYNGNPYTWKKVFVLKRDQERQWSGKGSHGMSKLWYLFWKQFISSFVILSYLSCPQGGLSTHDEMCVSYLFYYPKMAVGLCTSLPTVEQMVSSIEGAQIYWDRDLR